MAQEQVHETILVRELADEQDYESLTGRSFTVSPERIREVFDRMTAMNVCLAGEVRLTASDIAAAGLEPQT
jgi:hypothetical protein